MGIINSERLNDIKNKVKAEMQRRNATEHNSSMEEYSGESWDFAKENEAGEPVTDEHVQKIIDPLLNVNDFLHDNSFKSGKSGIELSIDRAEQFVDRLSQIDKSSPDTGCRGNCTGLCKDACTGGCMGCEGCSGECSTSCGTSCGENCGGGCHGCSGGCYTGCTNTCGSGCTTSLKY